MRGLGSPLGSPPQSSPGLGFALFRIFQFSHFDPAGESARRKVSVRAEFARGREDVWEQTSPVLKT